MAYVTVPKDLSNVKTKVFLNLTKRQLVCFTPAVLLGVPLFFLLREPLGNSTATFCMMVVMLPFFLFALYERNGQPLEVIARQMIETKYTYTKKVRRWSRRLSQRRNKWTQSSRLKDGV